MEVQTSEQTFFHFYILGKSRLPPKKFYNINYWMTISQRMKQSGPWAVIVAQWVERTLPTPEVRGSNPVIGEILFTMNCIEKKCTI